LPDNFTGMLPAVDGAEISDAQGNVIGKEQVQMSGADGKVDFKDIPEGWYLWQETQAPFPFVHDTTIYLIHFIPRPPACDVTDNSGNVTHTTCLPTYLVKSDFNVVYNQDGTQTKSLKSITTQMNDLSFKLTLPEENLNVNVDGKQVNKVKLVDKFGQAAYPNERRYILNMVALDTTTCGRFAYTDLASQVRYNLDQYRGDLTDVSQIANDTSKDWVSTDSFQTEKGSDGWMLSTAQYNYGEMDNIFYPGGDNNPEVPDTELYAGPNLKRDGIYKLTNTQLPYGYESAMPKGAYYIIYFSKDENGKYLSEPNIDYYPFEGAKFRVDNQTPDPTKDAIHIDNQSNIGTDSTGRIPANTNFTAALGGCQKFYSNFAWDNFDWIYNWNQNTNYPTNSAQSTKSTKQAGQPAQNGSATNGTNFTLFGRAVILAPFSKIQPVIRKTVDKSKIKLGDTLTYTLTAENKKSEAATNYYMTDYLPKDVEYVSSSSNAKCGSKCLVYDKVNNTVRWNIGEIPANTTYTATILVKVKIDASNPVVLNRIRPFDNKYDSGFDSNGKACDSKSNDLACDSTPENPQYQTFEECVDANNNFDLSACDAVSYIEATPHLSKTVDQKQISPDGKLTYTLKVENYNSISIPNFWVTDYLPDQVKFINNSDCNIQPDKFTSKVNNLKTSPDACSVAYDKLTNNLIWYVGTLAPKTTYIITIEVKVKQGVKDKEVITNVVRPYNTPKEDNKNNEICSPQVDVCSASTTVKIANPNPFNPLVPDLPPTPHYIHVIGDLPPTGIGLILLLMLIAGLAIASRVKIKKSTVKLG
jgi:uncharacterized repeat protein (TIGR01451 family)